MTTKTIHINDDIRTVKLVGAQKFWHFFPAIIPFCIGLFYLSWYFLKVNDGILTTKEILTPTIVWTSLAALIFVFKKRRLRFKKIKISLSETEFKEKMQRIGQEENWTLSNNSKKLAVFLNGSKWTFGLKMTVLRFENYLLVNSMCDLDSRPSVSIFNENERNIKKLERNLKEASG